MIVFSLPGAFTPTCSSSHVPQVQPAGTCVSGKHGVDDIVCMSVNDAFVMNEWKTDQAGGEHHVHARTATVSSPTAWVILVGKEDLGFGKRSWRYSMLVKDGVVEKMFIEPDVPGDPFEVSDADTMLSYLAPAEQKPHDVTVFSRAGCPHCSRAKAALREAGIGFEALELNSEYTDRTLRAVSGGSTVPQVFIDGELIGGADELEAWLKPGHTKAA